MSGHQLGPIGQRLNESYEQAVEEAYRKRSNIRSLAMDSATHAALSEAFQAWQERRAATNPFPSYSYRASVPQRDPDGRAPKLESVFGFEINLDNTVEGIAWDTGPEPDPRFTFSHDFTINTPPEMP